MSEKQHNADLHHDHDHHHNGNDGHNHDHHHHHGHDHGEAHEAGGHGETADLTKIKALLDYMLDHNRHHAEELADMAHSLRHAGLEQAAASLEDGVKEFGLGSEHIARTLDLMKGGHS